MREKNAVFEIISVGKSHWTKGYTNAIDACRILKDQNIQFKYIIVGAAGDLELEYQICELGLGDDVMLLNMLPLDQEQNRILSSNLFLLPSIKDNISFTMLEAMALRTLVLSTNFKDVTEVIEDNKTGFIIPKYNPNLMADKIIEIIKLPESKHQKIIQDAKKLIALKYNEHQMLSGLLELYNDLCHISKD